MLHDAHGLSVWLLAIHEKQKQCLQFLVHAPIITTLTATDGNYAATRRIAVRLLAAVVKELAVAGGVQEDTVLV